MARVLLTGITGFIAKRIALDLLEAGHSVRGSLRSVDRAGEVREALGAHLTDPAALERLEFVELDLMRDAGWQEAMAGMDAVLHTASPFPLSAPRDPEALIRPAVDGALRALEAAQASGVTRVILTSSCAAIMQKDAAPGARLTEDDWTDPAHPTAGPYEQSKTLAEKAAWDFAARHPEMRLTVINPGLVLGAPLDRHYGSSLQVVERFLKGRDPAVPQLGFPVVDVADVAAMHLKALEIEATAGKRYIAAAGWADFPQMARELAEAYPDRRLVTRVAPRWLLRLMAPFDGAIRGILPSLGRRFDIRGRRAEAEMGIAFVPWQQALRRSADFLVRQGA
jgi:dihydroflavonol-4-reductase